MEFAVGDRVRLSPTCTVEQFLRQADGTAGVIIEIEGNSLMRGWAIVRWDNKNRHAYPMKYLENDNIHRRMPELDVTLDELHLAQELYAKLEGK